MRFLFVFLLALPLVGITALPLHAQLSCDLPPAPLNDPAALRRLQIVWDKTDFCIFNAAAFAEIISGGVPRDGIPPIDNPTFESVESASEWLQPQSPVIAVQLQAEARAYPLGILTRHEIVNDVIGDTPIAVTFCPLCNSALVFDRRYDGQVLRLGVSGLLRNSDLVMWDDLTQTWWQQFTGEGLVGTYTGALLTLLPSQVVSFGAFAEQFPHGQVLQPAGSGYNRNPYVGYDSSPQPFLFRGMPDPRLHPTERVLAGVIGGQPMAYPFATLEQERVINDTIGSREVVIFWQPGAASALDKSLIDESRDVGMAAMYSRRVDSRLLSFTINADGVIHDEQTGSAWNVFGQAVAGPLLGTQLALEFAAPHFWFAWAAFQPETLIYGQ